MSHFPSSFDAGFWDRAGGAPVNASPQVGWAIAGFQPRLRPVAEINFSRLKVFIERRAGDWLAAERTGRAASASAPSRDTRSTAGQGPKYRPRLADDGRRCGDQSPGCPAARTEERRPGDQRGPGRWAAAGSSCAKAGLAFETNVAAPAPKFSATHPASSARSAGGSVNRPRHFVIPA
jgi:hypothetical protein